MRVYEPGDGTSTEQPPPAPPPAAPPPAGGGGNTPPAQPGSKYPCVNAKGETVEQAEAAVLALVAGGMLGADALALHPLPPCISTADALNFLASLPQTVYDFGQPGGTVIGPPIDTQPGFIPYDDADYPDDEGAEADDAEYAEWDDYVDLLEDAAGAPI